ncbi:MAG: FMN-binding protein [Elusimicrobiota bacterium]
MRKKIIFVFLSEIFLLSGTAFSVRYMTRKEALNKIFKDCDRIVEEKVVLSGLKEKKVREKLGGSLFDWTPLSRAERKKFTEKSTYTFYFGIKEGKKTGAALIETQPGKWGPMEFLIQMSMDGKVQQIKVLMHEETRARPICRRAFLMQFDGKTPDDGLEMGKDIYGVTGATVSSNAVAFAVKKALIIYKELILDEI